MHLAYIGGNLRNTPSIRWVYEDNQKQLKTDHRANAIFHGYLEPLKKYKALKMTIFDKSIHLSMYLLAKCQHSANNNTIDNAKKPKTQHIWAYD